MGYLRMSFSLSSFVIEKIGERDIIKEVNLWLEWKIISSVYFITIFQEFNNILGGGVGNEV